jgi:hypothetical protein
VLGLLKFIFLLLEVDYLEHGFKVNLIGVGHARGRGRLMERVHSGLLVNVAGTALVGRKFLELVLVV